MMEKREKKKKKRGENGFKSYNQNPYIRPQELIQLVGIMSNEVEVISSNLFSLLCGQVEIISSNLFSLLCGHKDRSRILNGEEPSGHFNFVGIAKCL
jgi:hypothetical protein